MRSKSKIKKSPKSKTTKLLSIEEEVLRLANGSSLCGKGTIEQDFCGHDPEICISSIPQWLIEYDQPIPSFKVKFFFQPKHQKCFFFSAACKSERVISEKDPDTSRFKRYKIEKDQQIIEIDVKPEKGDKIRHIIGIIACSGPPLDFGFVINENPPIKLTRLKYINDMKTNLLITEKPWHIIKTKLRKFTGHNPGLFTCKQYIMHIITPGIVCIDVYAKTQQSLSANMKSVLAKLDDQGSSDFPLNDEMYNRAPLLLIIQEGKERINHEDEKKESMILTTQYTHNLFFFEAKQGDYVLCPCIGKLLPPEKLTIVLHSEGKARVESLDLNFPQTLSCNIDLEDGQQFIVKSSNGEDSRIYITFRPDVWAVLYIKWTNDEGTKTDYLISSPKLRIDNPEFFVDLSGGKKLILTVATKKGDYKIGQYSLMVSSRNSLEHDVSTEKIDFDALGNIHKDLPDIVEEEKEEEEDENDGENKSSACILI